MDVSLLSFGQQNQWQYLSNLSKQKGGGVLMNTHCNGHLNLTISTRSYVHLYDVFLGAITDDTCTYKYGILVLIFVLWFLFGFGFFLLVSVETCSDILKGLQKKSLNTWSLNTYMWRYTLYTWVILLQNLRYLLVRESDMFNQHFMGPCVDLTLN